MSGYAILGAGLLFMEIIQAGVLGIVKAILVVTVVWYVCFWIARKLRVDDDFAAGLHADELVATNLDYGITPGLDELRAHSSAPPAQAFRKAMEDARAVAARVGLAFRPIPSNREEWRSATSIP